MASWGYAAVGSNFRLLSIARGPFRWKWKVRLLVNSNARTSGSRVVPHLRGERSDCPAIPPVHWKGVALSRQRSLRTPRLYPIVRAFKVCFLKVRDFYI